MNYKHKKMLPLTILEYESRLNKKVCYICEKEFQYTDKKFCKVNS